MKKLCCVFNTPSLYREAIYTRIEEKFDCDWYFEDTDNQLKEFDTQKFRNVKRQRAFSIGPFYGVKGMFSILKNKKYSHFLMMGHSRNISTLAFLIMKSILYPSKKVYLWTHGLYGKESKIEFLWKKVLYSLSDELLIYGDYACQLMINKGFDSRKIHAIHNSLNYYAHIELRKTIQPSNIYKGHFGNDVPTLIFIGRLNPVKRLDMLLNAVSSLKQKGETYNLVFIGEGPDMNHLKDVISKLGIESQVWFYGACYDEAINAELIYNADLCVAPGNIGLTSIHALTFGCPAITHNDFSHQMPEFEAIKEGLTGTFFEYGNIDSLSEGISKWFNQQNYNREKIRSNCYREIDSNWTPEYQINLIESLI